MQTYFLVFADLGGGPLFLTGSVGVLPACCATELVNAKVFQILGVK